MKTNIAAALALIVVSSPTFALKVTNLDTVEHTIELSGTGKPERHVIQPNATEQFTGAPQGFISVVTAQKEASASGKKSPAKPTKKPEAVVHADGLLSGIIGNGRTHGIPVDPANKYVIWPGGRITLQGRTNRSERR